ncbi:MAG: hypothetical protein PHG64_05100 [Paludibacter sp.]|nr:hypothetical protein [Paludibacter sp.]
MILNPTYYENLLSSDVKSECSSFTPKVVSMSVSLILSNYSKRNILINTPNFHEAYCQIISIIFEKLSISIFQKYADFPPIIIGSKWKHKKYSQYNFEVESFNNGVITLVDKKSGTRKTPNEENLYRNYWPAQNRNVQPIKEYRDSFKDYSEWFNTFGTIPTYFSKKVVFISSKTTWELCRKHNTPSIYLPNKREDCQAQIKSIPALDDCIAYFTPKYEVCFEQLLEHGKPIDTIVLCDTELDLIPQILQDQARYNFKLIILSNRNDNLRYNGVLSWNWKKEELDLLKLL